jgi:hypothetical protein
MYNATVYRYDTNGKHVSTFTAQATPAGVLLRSNAVQCTGLEGSEAYDAYVRRNAFAGYALRVELDGCAGYRNALRGLALPPAYAADDDDPYAYGTGVRRAPLS